MIITISSSCFYTVLLMFHNYFNYWTSLLGPLIALLISRVIVKYIKFWINRDILVCMTLYHLHATRDQLYFSISSEFLSQSEYMVCQYADMIWIIIYETCLVVKHGYGFLDVHIRHLLVIPTKWHLCVVWYEHLLYPWAFSHHVKSGNYDTEGLTQ